MTARSDEAGLIQRCAWVARGAADAALDRREAHIFRLAAMTLAPHFRQEAARLRDVSDDYFTTHPGEQLNAQATLQQGWVTSLPRLRELLSARLKS